MKSERDLACSTSPTAVAEAGTIPYQRSLANPVFATCCVRLKDWRSIKWGGPDVDNRVAGFAPAVNAIGKPDDVFIAPRNRAFGSVPGHPAVP